MFLGGVWDRVQVGGCLWDMKERGKGEEFGIAFKWVVACGK